MPKIQQSLKKHRKYFRGKNSCLNDNKSYPKSNASYLKNNGGYYKKKTCYPKDNTGKLDLPSILKDFIDLKSQMYEIIFAQILRHCRHLPQSINKNLSLCRVKSYI